MKNVLRFLQTRELNPLTAFVCGDRELIHLAERLASGRSRTLDYPFILGLDVDEASGARHGRVGGARVGIWSC